MTNFEASHQTNRASGATAVVELFVDPRQRRQLSRSIYQQLRERIADGRLGTGDRLPPSRELAQLLGVSRHTVTVVYEQLVAEGYLTGKVGGGTFVNDARPAAAAPTAAAPVPATERGIAADVQFDLRPGSPDPALFPHTAWARCLRGALRQPLSRAAEPAGEPALREALAHWIGRSRGIEAGAGRIVVTSGAQQAIDLVLRTTLRPGDVVAIEEPGYWPVRRLCEAIGASVVPVAVDAEGIVVDAIPAATRVVYTTPAHQFPTGAVLSLPRRLALLDHASRHDSLVIEDDYDSEYRHVARPLEPLHRLDGGERVVSVHTFSKVLWPTLRIGFCVLPQWLVEPVTELRELVDFFPPEPMQAAMTSFVDDGHLARHLRRTRRVYTDRHRALTRALDEHGMSHLPTCAGLHVSTLLDAGSDEAAIVEAAARAGIAAGAYATCWQRRDPPPGLVLGFGGVGADRLDAAIARLSAVISGSVSS